MLTKLLSDNGCSQYDSNIVTIAERYWACTIFALCKRWNAMIAHYTRAAWEQKHSHRDVCACFGSTRIALLMSRWYVLCAVSYRQQGLPHRCFTKVQCIFTLHDQFWFVILLVLSKTMETVITEALKPARILGIAQPKPMQINRMWAWVRVWLLIQCAGWVT